MDGDFLQHVNLTWGEGSSKHGIGSSGTKSGVDGCLSLSFSLGLARTIVGVDGATTAQW